MSDGGIHIAYPHAHPHVALVTLDRPPVNALVDASYAELEQAFTELDDDAAVHAVVLTATGTRAFCAGAELGDLDGVRSATDRSFQRVRTRAFDAIGDCSVPIVGAINGPALGAGLMIASLCDVLIATPNATFGLPEVDVGVLGGAAHVARLLPANCVRRIALTGERLGAEQVMRLGGISEVVDQAELLDAAYRVADLIAAKSTLVVRMTKRALAAAEHLDLHHGHRIEQVHMLALASQETTSNG